jgi:hypothetical protein
MTLHLGLIVFCGSSSGGPALVRKRLIAFRSKRIRALEGRDPHAPGDSSLCIRQHAGNSESRSARQCSRTNVTPNLVSKCGPALKLLSLVKKHGIAVVA